MNRSGEIPRFLAWLTRLSNDHLKLIWDTARESAHESIRHAVLQLLQGLFVSLSKEQVGGRGVAASTGGDWSCVVEWDGLEIKETGNDGIEWKLSGSTGNR